MGHQGNRYDSGDHGVGRVHDARAHNIANGIQIVGQPRHQVAGAMLVVITGVLAHQMFEEVVAQVVLNIA